MLLLFSGCVGTAPPPPSPPAVAPVAVVDVPPAARVEPDPALPLRRVEERFCRIRRVTERVAAELAARPDRDSVLLCLETPDEDDLATLRRVPWVQRLGIGGLRVRPLDLRKVPRLRELRHLKIGSRASSLATLSTLPAPRVLSMSGATDADVVKIGKLERLREVDLRYADARDLSPLGALVELEKLAVSRNWRGCAPPADGGVPMVPPTRGAVWVK